MTTAIDDARLERLEGLLIEQSAILQELRNDIREGFQQMNARFDEISALFGGANDRFDQMNNRIRQLTLAIIGVGGTVTVAIFSFFGVFAFHLIQNG